MEGNEDKVEPSSRFALFTELVCSLSSYKQITDTGLKPMRHIIIHEAPCQHHTETAKYNIVPQRPDKMLLLSKQVVVVLPPKKPIPQPQHSLSIFLYVRWEFGREINPASYHRRDIAWLAGGCISNSNCLHNRMVLTKQGNGQTNRQSKAVIMTRTPTGHLNPG